MYRTHCNTLTLAFSTMVSLAMNPLAGLVTSCSSKPISKPNDHILLCTHSQLEEGAVTPVRRAVGIGMTELCERISSVDDS